MVGKETGDGSQGDREPFPVSFVSFVFQYNIAIIYKQAVFVKFQVITTYNIVFGMAIVYIKKI